MRSWNLKSTLNFTDFKTKLFLRRLLKIEPPELKSSWIYYAGFQVYVNESKLGKILPPTCRSCTIPCRPGRFVNWFEDNMILIFFFFVFHVCTFKHHTNNYLPSGTSKFSYFWEQYYRYKMGDFCSSNLIILNMFLPNHNFVTATEMNLFMHNVEKLRILQCSHSKICKVCLAIFQHYVWKKNVLKMKSLSQVFSC